jgi:hypothetical protein
MDFDVDCGGTLYAQILLFDRNASAWIAPHFASGKNNVLQNLPQKQLSFLERTLHMP